MSSVTSTESRTSISTSFAVNKDVCQGGYEGGMATTIVGGMQAYYDSRSPSNKPVRFFCSTMGLDPSLLLWT
jgi:hypothetical protein